MSRAQHGISADGHWISFEHSKLIYDERFSDHADTFSVTYNDELILRGSHGGRQQPELWTSNWAAGNWLDELLLSEGLSEDSVGLASYCQRIGFPDYAAVAIAWIWHQPPKPELDGEPSDTDRDDMRAYQDASDHAVTDAQLDAQGARFAHREKRRKANAPPELKSGEHYAYDQHSKTGNESYQDSYWLEYRGHRLTSETHSSDIGGERSFSNFSGASARKNQTAQRWARSLLRANGVWFPSRRRLTSFLRGLGWDEAAINEAAKVFDGAPAGGISLAPRDYLPEALVTMLSAVAASFVVIFKVAAVVGTIAVAIALWGHFDTLYGATEQRVILAEYINAMSARNQQKAGSFCVTKQCTTVDRVKLATINPQGSKWFGADFAGDLVEFEYSDSPAFRVEFVRDESNAWKIVNVDLNPKPYAVN